jgi:glycosyltransferase involved in cell wall biosynthesis
LRETGGGGTGVGAELSIVHLCAPAQVGGLERVVQGLACGQRARRHRVALVAVVDPTATLTAFFEPFTDAAVEVVKVPLAARSYLQERRAVRQFLKSWQPDVLHTHGYRSDILNGGPARRLGVATVSTLHGSSRMGGFSHFFEWVQERALRKFDGVVAVSRPLREELQSKGVASERVHLVPNAWVPLAPPIDRASAQAALGIDGSSTRIGWVGRLIPIKGPDVFLRALRALASDQPWIASIIGDGPERPASEMLVRSSGLARSVQFHGAMPGAGRIFPAFDLLVLSSRSEGTPMVLFEAMAAGVPIVATAVGGVPDVLGERAGWLVPPEDPDALATAIRHAISDPVERSLRAERAMARLNAEFGMELWLERHDAVYRSAMARRLRSGTAQAPAGEEVPRRCDRCRGPRDMDG